MQKALIRDQVFAKKDITCFLDFGRKIVREVSVHCANCLSMIYRNHDDKIYLDFGCKFVREVSANCANCLSMIYHNHADKIYMMMLLYVLYVVV